ncbi:hypothetical protein EDC04DRAFT_2610863 [Pisolithus marmoratus]|nr:hypothetical protein EDC04DRAFT_2610863 [Pisolithus marmoratus]
MLVVGPNSTCDVCLECYTNGVNIPHAINCGHVFCQKCLEHLVQNKCPLCRMPFEPSEVRKLHVDRDPNVKATVEEDAAQCPPSVPAADEEAQRLLNEIARIVKEGAKIVDIRRVIDECRTYYKSQGDQYTPVRVSCLLLHNLAESQRKLSLQAEDLKELRAERDNIHEHLTGELEAVKRDYEQLWRTTQEEKATLLATEKCLRDRYDEMNQSWLREILSLEEECDALKQTLARLQPSYSESQRSAYFYASEVKRSPSTSEDVSMLKKHNIMKEKLIGSDEMDLHLSPLAEISAPLASTLQGFCALADEPDDEDVKMKKKKKLLDTLTEDEPCPEGTLGDFTRQPLTSEPIPIPSRACPSHQPSNSVAMSVTADGVSGLPSSRTDDVVMGSRPPSPCLRSSSDRHVPSSQAPQIRRGSRSRDDASQSPPRRGPDPIAEDTWQIVSSGVSKLHDLLDSPRRPPSLSQSTATGSRPDISRLSTTRPPTLAQPSASRSSGPVRPSSASVYPGSSSTTFIEDRRPLVSASEAAMQLERERQQKKERRRQMEASSIAQNSLRDTTNAPTASHYHQPPRYKYGNDRTKPIQPLPSATLENALFWQSIRLSWHR